MKNNKVITLSIGKAADCLGVHIDTVRNWDRSGLINSIRTPGGHRRYLLEEVNKMLNNNYVENWGKIGLLDLFPDNKKELGATVLENQRLFNERSDLPSGFMRISIPLVCRVFSKLTNFTSSIGVWGAPLLTDISYKGSNSLDEDVSICADLANRLVDWIGNSDGLNFGAFGLRDNKIVIY